MKFLIKEKEAYLLFLFLLSVYIVFQSRSVYGGDSGDLIAAAATGSFAHPPGYPLYSLLASLLIKLPWGTPAWRVAWLSSIPSALGLTILYLILKKNFDRHISLAVTLFMAFLYPVFLYSVVSELFALNTMFVLLLWKLMLDWNRTADRKYLHWFFGVLGFGLAHHHYLLFAFPAYFYLLIRRCKLAKCGLGRVWMWIIPGLLVYMYLPVSSILNDSPFYWGNGSSWSGFWDIITRRIYGPFRAFGGIGEHPIQRVLNAVTFLRYLNLQYQIIGVIFVIVGSILLLLRRSSGRGSNRDIRPLADSSLILFVFFLFFIFYANFPLTNDFQMATVERFYILPLIILAPLICLGAAAIVNGLATITNPTLRRIANCLFVGIIILLPTISLMQNGYKIWILKSDRTAENLGWDILNSLPNNSILTLGSDTSIFNTEYIHYALGARPDILIFRPGFIHDKTYQQKIITRYPGISIPDAPAFKDDYFSAFLDQNIERFPIFTNIELAEDRYRAVPEGLLMRFYPPEATPSAQQVFTTNAALTARFQDFSQSSLVRYQNLFLTDTKTTYIIALRRIVQYFIDQGEHSKAGWFMDQYQRLAGKNDYLGWLYQGQISLGQARCRAAELAFRQAKSLTPNSGLIDGFLRKTYLECFQDQAAADQYLNSCIEKEANQATQLKDL